jgi:hypothetical protein
MMTMVKAAVDNLEGLVGAMVQPVCVPNDTASFSCSKRERENFTAIDTRIVFCAQAKHAF